MWDLPGPGIEPVSPALAGGFLTTAPPGKSLEDTLKLLLLDPFLYIKYTFLQEKAVVALLFWPAVISQTNDVLTFLNSYSLDSAFYLQVT